MDLTNKGIKMEKIYCGKGKQSKYGIKLNICLNEIPQEHMTKLRNGNTYVNLEVKESRQPDQKGNTHYVEVNTWKPNNVKSEVPAAQSQHPNDDDDLPF